VSAKEITAVKKQKRVAKLKDTIQNREAVLEGSRVDTGRNGSSPGSSVFAEDYVSKNPAMQPHRNLIGALLKHRD